MSYPDCDDLIDQLAADFVIEQPAEEAKEEAVQPIVVPEAEPADATVSTRMLTWWATRGICSFVGNWGRACQQKLKGAQQTRCAAHITSSSFVRCCVTDCGDWHRGTAKFGRCKTHSAVMYAITQENKKKAARAEEARKFEERHANTKLARRDAKKAAAIEARSRQWPPV